MIGIDCLAFVSIRGHLTASPTVGVTKVEKGGRGLYLLDHVVRPGAKVQVSALPRGWVHDVKQTEHGLLVRIFDTTARPNDHGFVLKIESPKTPATLPPAAPVPEFSTSVRGELGPGDAPSATEPILATTAADDAPTTSPETPAATSDDDEEPATSFRSSASKSKRK